MSFDPLPPARPAGIIISPRYAAGMKKFASFLLTLTGAFGLHAAISVSDPTGGSASRSSRSRCGSKGTAATTIRGMSYNHTP
jgi:hypothetical protein